VLGESEEEEKKKMHELRIGVGIEITEIEIETGERTEREEAANAIMRQAEMMLDNLERKRMIRGLALEEAETMLYSLARSRNDLEAGVQYETLKTTRGMMLSQARR